MEQSASPEVIEPWRDFWVLAERARQHYIDLPYHNWEHAEGVCEIAIEKAQLCIENDIEVDLDVIVAASLYHDAGFWAITSLDKLIVQNI